MIYLLIFINSHRHDLKSNTFNRPDKFQRHIKTLLSARTICLMQFHPLYHHGIRAEPSHWTFDFSTHDHHIKASRILTAALSTGFQWKFLFCDLSWNTNLYIYNLSEFFWQYWQFLQKIIGQKLRILKSQILRQEMSAVFHLVYSFKYNRVL